MKGMQGLQLLESSFAICDVNTPLFRKKKTWMARKAAALLQLYGAPN
jgi:hypothetical protein